MKKKILFGISAIAIIAALSFNITLGNNGNTLASVSLNSIAAIASASAEGGYSCEVTVDCAGRMGGSISCRGQKCERGNNGWSFWVKCDGKTTEC